MDMTGRKLTSVVSQSSMNNPERVIRTESLTGPTGQRMEEVMAGEIAGMTCFLHNLPQAGDYDVPVSGQTSRVFFFLEGRGVVTCADRQHAVEEIAVFAPGNQTAAGIRAVSKLVFLELRMEMSPDDLAWAAGRESSTPFFATYSKCRTYREAIKSEKTVSRTLLPDNIIPRFCAGSVQTTGPDQVGAHRHPMLEQLFMGLSGNDCRVYADDASCAFGGNVLLHIPLGSEHSVRVDPGKELHYIWIDRFRSAEGIAWITQNHFENV